MTILTDDLIEKGARAAYVDLCEKVTRVFCASVPPRHWEELLEKEREHHRSRARAALLAVLPDVVEKCAKEAEGYGPSNPGANHTSAGIRIAASIRFLLNKEDNANG